MEFRELVEATSRGHRSAQEMVVEGLREGILSGLLEGGRPLRQVEIAAWFGVSSIPVREALRRLEGEGLVTFYPRRGAVVSELSREEVREICEIRESLEILALRKAMPGMAEEDVRRAEEILDLADRRTDEEVLTRWGEINWEFHAALYRSAGRPRLLAMIKNLHTNFDRYLRLHFSALDYREKGQQEHRRILEHCRRRDEDAAVEALRHHIRTVSGMLLAYLDGEDGKDAS